MRGDYWFHLLLALSIAVAVLAGQPSAAAADAPSLRLPAIFGDHMVMQRNAPIRVWGWARPGAEVKAALAEWHGSAAGNPLQAEATADAAGQWAAELPAVEDGRHGYILVVSSGDEEVTVSDIIAGDVWMASGQSNMEWQVVSSDGAKEAIEAADYPDLRFFRPSNREAAIEPRDDLEGQWVACSPETAGRFSAVAFHFARAIQERHPDVNIGIVDTSWSGLPAQSYISIEKLDADPAFAGYAGWYRGDREKYVPPAPEDIARQGALRREADAAYARLREIAWDIPEGAREFASPDFDDSTWNAMSLPTLWEQAGVGLDAYDGVVWFRRTVDLPAELVGQDLTLALGCIDDMDITFVNGQEIGRGLLYNEKRVYAVPAAASQAGKLAIAIRVVDTGGGGGIYTGPLLVSAASGQEAGAAVDLSGEWKFLPEPGYEPPPAVGDLPGAVSPWTPTSLYNSWIAPLVRFPIRGAIWYQGESNAGDWRLYRQLFPALIEDWRARWGQDFPFYWVQLASFMERGETPRDTDWAGLREAQSLALRLPATGQAVAIDLGEAEDIHPRNKRDVGRRLALWALRDAYGGDVEPSGPVLRDVEIDGVVVALAFDHIGGGLKQGLSAGALADFPEEGLYPSGFALAGEDGEFGWARAYINEPDTIVLLPMRMNPGQKPVAIRYAWDDNPLAPVYSAEGLPMAPFRWPVP